MNQKKRFSKFFLDNLLLFLAIAFMVIIIILIFALKSKAISVSSTSAPVINKGAVTTVSSTNVNFNKTGTITNPTYLLHAKSYHYGILAITDNGTKYEITDPPEFEDGQDVMLVMNNNKTPDNLTDDFVISVEEEN